MKDTALTMFTTSLSELSYNIYKTSIPSNKLLTNSLSTSLVIFIFYGLIDWKAGLILACGNMSGAWLGTRLSIKWGATYIRYILLAALLIVALKLFGLF